MGEAKLNVIKYLCNPDVVLREEDEDGGLLFNPDTNQAKVINSTGLFIWKQFSKPHMFEDMIVALQTNFKEAPTEIIQTDLKEFLDEMIQSGFIGEIK